MDNVLRNCWYMAGWADEIGDAQIARRIADIPILIFRDEDGAPCALEDRCPHRFAPLRMGTFADGRVSCPYHGLTFDGSGACVANPFSDNIPAAARVPNFAVAEQDGILWIWLGDAKADAALIPDFSFLPDTPTNRTVRGYLGMAAPYEYGTDNLMDLSHIEFVHRGTFAGQGVIFAGTHEVVQDGETLHSNWWMPGVAPPSMATGVYPLDAKVDHWLDMRWNAPASMRLDIGVTPAGAPREGGFFLPQAHIVTPASPTTSHYFWASSRPNDVQSTDLDAALVALFSEAFLLEDKPVIEAAFANTDGVDFWDRRPVFLGIDAGGTRARRLLQQMVRDENARAPVSA